MRYKNFATFLLLISTLLLWGCFVINVDTDTEPQHVESDTVQRFAIIKSDDWAHLCCLPSVSGSQTDDSYGYDLFLYIANKHSVPITLGVMGYSAEHVKEFYKYVLNQGHEIGNHTYTHENLLGLLESGGIESVRSNIQTAHNAILQEVCSEVSPATRSNCAPSTFFPTFNLVNEQIIKEIVGAGYKHIFLTNSQPRSDIKVLPIGCPGASETLEVVYTFRFDSNTYKEAGDVPLCVVEVHPAKWRADSVQQFENMLIFLKAQGVQIVTPKQFFAQVKNSDAYLSYAYEMQKTYAISQDQHILHNHEHPHPY